MEPRIKTTVVGSYPFPEWLAALPSEQALLDATRVVIHTQEKAGIDVTDLTSDDARRYGYGSSAKGVLVTDVQEGSVAAEAGLRPGMLITKINNRAVDSASTVRDRLQKANLENGVLLQVKYPKSQGGGTRHLIPEDVCVPVRDHPVDD